MDGQYKKGLLAVVALIFQNTILVLTMRYSRIQSTVVYVSSTAVLVAELLKMLAAFCIVVSDEGGIEKSIQKIAHQLHSRDMLLVSIPSLLYTVQNNLLYIAISHLDTVSFQTAYQTKLLTTAAFMMLVLGKRFTWQQWLALLLLFAGIVTVQFPSSTNTIKFSRVGLTAVVLASACSGFCSAYIEKLLKTSATSIWIRNIQLGLFGTLFGALALIPDRNRISQEGFFVGYSALVWIIICLQSFGGLCIAVVMKYASNIEKGFACAISLVLSSSIAANFIDHTPISVNFITGTALVVGATILYSYAGSFARTETVPASQMMPVSCK